MNKHGIFIPIHGKTGLNNYVIWSYNHINRDAPGGSHPGKNVVHQIFFGRIPWNCAIISGNYEKNGGISVSPPKGVPEEKSAFGNIVLIGAVSGQNFVNDK